MIELIPSGPFDPGSGSGGDMEVHELFGEWHTGALDESQAPWVDVKIATAIDALELEGAPHDIVGTLHTITGNAFDLVGATSLNTLGLLTPSSNPGAFEKILKTDAAGLLTLTQLNTPIVSSTLNLTLSPTLDLNLAPASNMAVVHPDTRLQSYDFQSQLQGWRITYQGEGDFRYLYSDQMKVKVFIADITQALAGSEIITKSVTTLAEDFIIPLPGESVTLYVDDLPSATNMAVFEEGDFVRIREFNREGGVLEVLDCWGTVTDYDDMPSRRQAWTFTRHGTIPAITSVGTVGYQTNFDSSIVIDANPSVVEGDLLFAFIVTDRSSGTVSVPSGWIIFGGDTQSNFDTTLAYKYATGSEPASYTFGFGGVTGYNAVSLYAYRGVRVLPDTFQTWFDSVSADVGAETNSIVFPSASTSSSIDRGLVFAAFYDTSLTIDGTPPTGYTGLIESAVDGRVMFAAERQFTDFTTIPALTIPLSDPSRFMAFSLNLVPKATLTLETGYAEQGTVIEKESVVLDYGVSGNGYIEMTTIDGIYGSNSPYTRIVNWTGHPATGSVTRTLMGNLNGLFSPPGEYGFYAGLGTGSNDSYFKASSSEVRMNNIPLKMFKAGGLQTVNISADGQDIWVGLDPDNKRLTWDGATLSVQGQIIITGGSGYTALTDKPTTLGDINVDELAHLGSIEAGATVGATWGTNLNSVPGRFGDSPSATGLYLTPTHLGFYDATATAWKAWIADNGFFYFGGDSGAHLEWNGVKLRGIGTDGTTEQWYANSTDGKLYAGAGDVILDTNGIGIKASTSYALKNALSFLDSSGVEETRIFTANSAFETILNVEAIPNNSSTNRDATINIIASPRGTGLGRIYLTAPDGINIDGPVIGDLVTSSHVYIAEDMSLYFGGITHTNDDGLRLFHSSNTNSYIDFVGSALYIRGGTNGATPIMTINDGGSVQFNGVLGSSWDGLTFGTGWANFGSGWTTGQIKKVGDMIYIRGLVFRFSGTGTTIATLPVGYRPNAPILCPSMSNDALCRVDIEADGTVSYVSGGSPGSWVWLNHSFSTLP